MNANDARDDFSAQLRKGVSNQWMSSEDIADLDGYEFHDGANFEQENDDQFNAENIQQLHQEDHMFLPDISTLSSGAPEESATSCTSLAEKDSKLEIFYKFINIT